MNTITERAGQLGSGSPSQVAQEGREAARGSVSDIRLRVAMALSVIGAGLVAMASAGGLFIPGLYRDIPTTVLQNQGQDLATLLLALPALAVALLSVRHRSKRAVVVWIGLLGYLLYSYSVAAFGYSPGAFSLIYTLTIDA